MKYRIECRICGSKLAKYHCKNCNAYVCEDCYDNDSGLCVNCKWKKRENEKPRIS